MHAVRFLWKIIKLKNYGRKDKMQSSTNSMPAYAGM